MPTKHRTSSAATAPAPDATAEPRRGRRTDSERANQPFTTPYRRRDTGRWVFSFDHPKTGAYQKKVMVRCPQTGAPLVTDDPAVALQAAAVQYGRLKRGTPPVFSHHPATLLPDFIAHQRRRSGRPDRTEQELRLALCDLGEFSSFAHCTNLANLDATDIREIADELARADGKVRASSGEGQSEADGIARPPREIRATPNWVRTRLQVLRLLLKWAENFRRLPPRSTLVAEVLRDYRRPQRPDDFFFDVEEAAAFERALEQHLPTPSGQHLWILCWLLIYTGARRSELMCVRVGDVLFGGTSRFRFGALRVFNSKKRDREQSHRSSTFREVPLFPKLRAVLEELIEQQNLSAHDFLCLSPLQLARVREQVTDMNDIEAVHHAVVALSESPLCRLLTKLCQDAGITPHGSAHIWRHSYIATRSRMVHRSGNAVTLADLQQEVGHILDSPTTNAVYQKSLHLPLPGVFDALDWSVMAAAQRANHAQEQQSTEWRTYKLPEASMLASRAVKAMRARSAMHERTPTEVDAPNAACGSPRT